MNTISMETHETGAERTSFSSESGIQSRGHHPLFRLLLLFSSLALSSHAGEVVINEIMFHPSSHQVADEYLELHNVTTRSIDLLDWRLDRGIDFVFTNHVVIPAHGFVVVAADTEAFAIRYPSVSAVVGNWTGSLANSGESIRLVDPQGLISDEVRYADSGDFAIRFESFSTSARGWNYLSTADGRGPSLERLDPERTGLVGANWGSSLSQVGTPGSANSQFEPDSAPFVFNLSHAPAIPRSTDPVTITAQVQTNPGTPPPSLSLFYRTVSSLKPAGFTEIPMADDGSQNDGLAGDGRFGVSLQELPNRTVVEFYVQATSSSGQSRTYPPPARDRFGVEGQYVNALYQVDNSSYTGSQPTYALVLSETDRDSLANLPQVDPSSDVELHATFISTEGSASEIRYGCGVRLRGASSRFMNPPNYRVNIPSDRRWKGVTGLNLNLLNVHSQIAGYSLATRAGLVTEEHRPVQVRVNGVNLATTASPPLGVYAHAEVPDASFADHHFPEDSDGNVYRASSRGHAATLDYLGDDPIRYSSVGYSKTTHQSENDWSDLIRLTQALGSFGDADYLTRVKQSVNIPQWLTYFAVFNLIGSTETSLGTGVGDDYAMYRGVRDPRFQLIGHDWDSVLGEGGSAPLDIFQTSEIPLIDRLLKHQEIAPLYYGELLKQIQGAFSPGEVARVLDQNLTPWTPPATILNMKRFATNRISSLLNLIPVELKWRGGTTFANLGSALRFNTNNILLWGTSHAAKTRQVLVNGIPSDWRASVARWTNRITLSYGLNRLQIQSLDEQGNPFESTNTVAWLPPLAYTPLSGLVTNNQTLDPARSPYQVTNEWKVSSGATLTIAPGVSVIFSPGSRLTVEGRLEAIGTQSQPIFLTKDPSDPSPGIWEGIQANQSGATLRLSNVHLIGAGSSGACIQAKHSQLEIDHLTLAAALNIGLDIEDCSLSLSDSVFPGEGLSQAIQAQGIQENGQMIIARNLFSKLSSTNDVVRFVNAHRPGPILQLLDNDFLGGTDDLVELIDADAHIEGNLFSRAKGDGSHPGDLSSDVTVAGDAKTGHSVVVNLIRNRFLSSDHGVVVRNGARAIVENNTFHIMGFAAMAFDEPDRRAEGVTPGEGTLFSGNLVWSTPTNFLHVIRNNPQFGTTDLVVRLCLLSANDDPSGAPDTLHEDPRLADTRATLTTVKALRGSVELLAGSPARGSGPDGRDIGATATKGLTIRGEPASTTSASTVQLLISGAGYMEYRFSVDEGALSEPFDLNLPIILTDLSPGPHRVRILGRNTTGLWDSEFVESKTWRIDPTLSTIILSELLARNRTAFANDASYPDVIELQNVGTTPVDLDGMGLTDDAEQPHRFTFPPKTIIPPGGYQVVFAEPQRRTPLHTGFSLNAQGGQLLLFAPNTTNGPALDEIAYGPQATDFSIARLEEGRWDLAIPTLGQPNQAARVGNPAQLMINEWLADGTGEDFIELYNPDSLPIPLGGLALTDDTISYPTRHRIAPLSFIDGLGLQVFTADGRASSGPDHLNFRLSADGGLISLHSPSGATIDCFLYLSQVKDVSQGRSPSGAARIALFTEPTPGSPNPAPLPPFTREVQTYSTNLVSMTNQVWRYRQDNVNLLTAWRLPDYDDSGWLTGVGPFGLEDCNCLPNPIQTPLLLLEPDGQSHVRTYYFRTSFELPPFYGSNSSFIANFVYDDGVVAYLNGRLITRQGVPLTYNHNTFASSSITPEGRISSIPITATNVAPGVNVLAVELHQSDEASDDVVLGFSIRADRSVTNFISTQKVLLNEILARNQSLTNSEGSITDWVELYNPSPTQATDLSGMSLSDSTDNPRRWVIPAGSSIAAGGYRVIRLSSDLPASLADEPNLNAGFALKAEGDRLLLFDSASAGGGLLDGITFGLQAIDLSIGRYSTAGPLWELNIPSPGAPNLSAQLENPAVLKINEWMAAPASGDDWFELFNPGLFPVSLGGLYLSDSPAQPTQHRIPALSFIGTGTRGGYLQFRADGAPEKGADHVSFKLAAGGESIGLFGVDGATTLDLVTFGKQDTGISEGRLPDGATAVVRFPRSASPGSINTLPFSDVVVNEVITRREVGGAIELRNTSEYPQHIGGWWLSTDERNPRQFRIPDHTILPAGEVIVFEAATLATGGGSVGIGLVLEPGQVQTVYLSGVTSGGALTGLRSQTKAGISDMDLSTGRFETSTGFDSPLLSSPTLGRANSAPRVGPVVISEIHYHPKTAAGAAEADEFIELFNLSDAPVNLFSSLEATNTWHLRNAVDFDLPTATTLPANGFLLVVGFDPSTNAAQTASFRSRFGVPSTVAILGPWTGRLDNSGDTIELNSPTTPIGTRFPRALMDRVVYADLPPWPTAADGQGAGLGTSLQRRFLAGYGNEPTNWVAAPPTAGGAKALPAGTLPSFTTQPSDHTTSAGQKVSFTASVTGSGPFVYQWRLNGLDLSGATNSALVLTNVGSSDEGTYSVRVSNASGAAQSASARLRINLPPQIVRQPEGAVIGLGTTATLSLGFHGTAPVSIQWSRNGTNLAGETNAILSLVNIQTAQLGTYRATVTNRFGSSTSTAAVVEIETPPSFVSDPQPALLQVNEGQKAVLTADVAGSAPIRFQWRRNGQGVRNATNQTLVIERPRLEDSGLYTLLAANPAGAVTSATAKVSVRVAPSLNLTASNPIFREGIASKADFLIARTGTNDIPFDVKLDWGGTATAGADYEQPPTSVRLPAGSDTMVVSVNLIDDSVREPLEQIQLTLLASPDYRIGSNRTASVFIDDNENRPPLLVAVRPENDLRFPVSPTNIVFEIQATDPDDGDAVTNVVLIANQSIILGQWSSPPFVATWTNPPAGSNRVAAYAVDRLGASSFGDLFPFYLNRSPQVLVQQPSEGDFFNAGTPLITVTTAPSDPDGQVTSLAFYLGTNWVATLTNAPYSIQITNPPTGHQILRVIATDNEGQTSVTTERRFSVGVRPESFTDSFRARGLITGTNLSVSADNRNATTESGEPVPVFDGGVGRSLWIEWIAPVDGVCTLDTLGSRGPNGTPVDTIIAVYLGQQLNGLWEYISDDDGALAGPNDAGASQVRFGCEAGVSYQIRVSAYSTGNVRVNLAVDPEKATAINGDAVEASEMPWRTSTSSQWVSQRATTTDGVDALRIPTPTDNSATWVETTVEGPALLNFQWRMRGVSATFGSTVLRDRMVARIGGTQVIEQTRQGNWTAATIAIPSGPQTIRWTFLTSFGVGDTSIREGFLDQVKILRTRLSTVQFASPSVIEVQVQGLNGTPFTLESSEDLVNWSPVGSGKFDSNGSALLSITNLIEGLPKQFLRSRQVP